jgi:hypothetical protein
MIGTVVAIYFHVKERQRFDITTLAFMFKSVLLQIVVNVKERAKSTPLTHIFSPILE